MSFLQTNENKLDEEKKGLRQALDDAENRVTKGELARRALEGDLQRLKLAMNDKETESQVREKCVCVCVCVREREIKRERMGKCGLKNNPHPE